MACFTSGDSRARKGALYIEFVDNPGKERDPTPEAAEPDDLNNPKDIPGSAVRKQTLDLIALLELTQGVGHYYLFMEDDFMCANHRATLLLDSMHWFENGVILCA